MDPRRLMTNLPRISQHPRHNVPVILRNLACSCHDVPIIPWRMIDLRVLRGPLPSFLFLLEVASSSHHVLVYLHEVLPVSHMILVIVLSKVTSLSHPVLVDLHNDLPIPLKILILVCLLLDSPTILKLSMDPLLILQTPRRSNPAIPKRMRQGLEGSSPQLPRMMMDPQAFRQAPHHRVPISAGKPQASLPW